MGPPDQNTYAAARLLLQEEKPRPQEIQNELFKVEQYVEMVLGYLRTEDMASDIRFEEMDMDSLIREQIHKFARIFIGKSFLWSIKRYRKRCLQMKMAWLCVGTNFIKCTEIHKKRKKYPSI